MEKKLQNYCIASLQERKITYLWLLNDIKVSQCLL